MSIDNRAKQYGEIFGSWRIGERIHVGFGGKTEVFLLKRSHVDWEEESVLKVITIFERNGTKNTLSKEYQNAYLEEKKELCKKAEEEVRYMAKLSESPYIVRYLDFQFFDWEEERSFGCDLLIRMERLDTLRTLISQGNSYTEQDVIQIGKEICQALVQCHKESIVHRDIKPENIFRNSYGTYKLGDFGIARMIEDSQKASTMTGTPEYAAPEQVNHNIGETYDYRVDIYSLGLTLYELLNENCLPLASSVIVKKEELILRITGKQLEMPSKASEDLGKVILKACAYDPKDRYQSAQEFLNALVEVEQEEKSMKTQKKVQFKKEENSNKDLYATIPATGQNQEKQGVFEIVPEEKKQENTKEIKTWFQKLFDLGGGKKTLEIDYDYLVGKDEKKVFKYYQKIAKQGNKEAQLIVGECYYKGKGVEQDYREAVRWYRKAAEQGNAFAQNSLGDCYYYGKGVKQNDTEAIKWYQKVAEQGDIKAQYNLARRYHDGVRVKRDYREAVKWYQKAAEQGDIKAQYELARCYHRGIGVKKDYVEAVSWYRKAAEQGDAIAQYSLGVCYEYGRGVLSNITEARKWYQKAAEQGLDRAQSALHKW